jgi:hypothetical protein
MLPQINIRHKRTITPLIHHRYKTSLFRSFSRYFAVLTGHFESCLLVCFYLGVVSAALPSNIALLVAALDLQLVRLVRGAMADGAPAESGIRAVDRAEISPRFSIEPEPDIQPRRSISPEPEIEPRLVMHPDPAIERTPTLYAGPTEPEHHRDDRNPIQAPWEVLPWEQPLPVVNEVHIVKVLRYRPDRFRRGVLIDTVG